MRITVLGGSPKGPVSVTMQYVEFLRTNFPEHEFIIHQPAHEIASVERDQKKFDVIIGDVRSSSAVLWAFPLYVFTVCSQYQRFIELIGERDCSSAFAGKYSAALSTSIHFFDHTAHNYIRGVSDDLGMNFTGSFSAAMDDLTKPAMRRNLVSFFENTIAMASSGISVARAYMPIVSKPGIYVPEAPAVTVKTGAKKTVIVTDGLEGNLGRMVARVAGAMDPSPEIIDIQTLDIKGGCLGCLRCGPANVCAYTGKDAVISMFREKVMKADIVIYAGEMKGRHLSSRWKMFLDRSFFNTHQRVLPGKQLAFLVSGPLSQNFNLRQVLTAYAEWQNANLVDIVTDESPGELDKMLDGLAAKAVVFAEKNYVQPISFLGYAGMKVFRDDIYSDLRVIFQADHRVYKKNGVFDFPHNHPFRNIFIAIFAAIASIPWVSGKMMPNMRKFMIMPYQHLVKIRIRQ